MKFVLFLAVVALFTVALSASVKSAEEVEVNLDNQSVRGGSMCPCKCVRKRRGRKAQKQKCKQMLDICSIQPCVTSRNKRGVECCDIVTPEPMP